MDAEKLPANWIKKFSQSRGNTVYYFNQTTGESQWHRPMALPNPHETQKRKLEDSSTESGNSKIIKKEGSTPAQDRLIRLSQNRSAEKVKSSYSGVPSQSTQLKSSDISKIIRNRSTPLTCKRSSGKIKCLNPESSSSSSRSRSVRSVSEKFDKSKLLLAVSPTGSSTESPTGSPMKSTMGTPTKSPTRCPTRCPTKSPTGPIPKTVDLVHSSDSNDDVILINPLASKNKHWNSSIYTHKKNSAATAPSAQLTQIKAPVDPKVGPKASPQGSEGSTIKYRDQQRYQKRDQKRDNRSSDTGYLSSNNSNVKPSTSRSPNILSLSKESKNIAKDTPKLFKKGNLAQDRLDKIKREQLASLIKDSVNDAFESTLNRPSTSKVERFTIPKIKPKSEIPEMKRRNEHEQKSDAAQTLQKVSVSRRLNVPGKAMPSEQKPSEAQLTRRGSSNESEGSFYGFTDTKKTQSQPVPENLHHPYRPLLTRQRTENTFIGMRPALDQRAAPTAYNSPPKRPYADKRNTLELRGTETNQKKSIFGSIFNIGKSLWSSVTGSNASAAQNNRNADAEDVEMDVENTLAEIEFASTLNEDGDEMEWETSCDDAIREIATIRSMEDQSTPNCSNIFQGIELPQYSASNDDMSQKQVVIADTNVFLSGLFCIKDIIERDGPTVVLVPFMVLQELDKLKEQKMKSVSVLATRAIRFINEKFNEQNPKIKGQGAVDHRRHLIDIDSPDDKILNCCLQVKEIAQRILLLTNDVNLSNKALATRIETISSKQVLQRLST